MSIVVLAEKPSQAKAYADAFSVKKRTKTHIELNKCNTFPSGAIITWGIGHLVTLKLPNEYKEEWSKWNLKNLPIFPEQHEYKVTRDKKTQFNAVKKLFQQANTIINACDIDREGSNIFYSILNMTNVKGKKIKRLWINSLEVGEVKKGFKNLHDNDKDLLMYEEARTRQIADWLVGMNASQLFTLLLGEKGYNQTLSVGRVQSPTVNMIYDRQKEIENFISKPFYELYSKFEHKNGIYSGKAKIKEFEKAKIVDLLAAHNLSDLTYDQAKVKKVEKKEKRQLPPLLHSLSTLQTVANKKWKYSPAKVLELVQQLYEKKIVSYPRTDTNHITENEFAYLVSNIESYQKIIDVSFESNVTPKKRYVDTKKVEEHYAIIPTKTIPSAQSLEKLAKDERNIYEEILRTTLAMFADDYVYEETNIITEVAGIDFFTKGKMKVAEGWKGLFPKKKEQKSTNRQKSNENEPLPSVFESDLVVSSLEIKEGKTTPPKAFTEGALINLMKTAGKTIEDEEDSAILKEVEGIGTEATRSGIIETIKNNGYIVVDKNIVSVTDKGKVLCQSIEGSLLSSPSMTAKWEKYLKQIGLGKGSSDTFLNKIENFINTLIDESPKKLNSQELNLAIQSNVKDDGIGTCPSCSSGVISDKGKFYGCSGYRNGCRFTLPKRWAGKTIPKGQIEKLVKVGKTNLIKGFKSKKGKKFDAYLVLNDGKLKMEF